MVDKAHDKRRLCLRMPRQKWSETKDAASSEQESVSLGMTQNIERLALIKVPQHS